MHNSVWRVEGFTIEGMERWIPAVRGADEDAFFVLRRRELPQHGGSAPPVTSVYLGVSAIGAGVVQHLSWPFQRLAMKGLNTSRAFVAPLRLATFGVTSDLDTEEDCAKQLLELHVKLLTDGFHAMVEQVRRRSLTPEVSFNTDELAPESEDLDYSKRVRFADDVSARPAAKRRKAIPPAQVLDADAEDLLEQLEQSLPLTLTEDDDVDMQLLSEGFWDQNDDIMSLLDNIAVDEVTGGDFIDSLWDIPSAEALAEVNGTSFVQLSRWSGGASAPSGASAPTRRLLPPPTTRGVPAYVLHVSGTHALLRALLGTGVAVSVRMELEDTISVESPR